MKGILTRTPWLFCYLLLACSPEPEELLVKGKSLMQENKFEQAVPYLNRALEKRPEWSEAYNVRAVAFFEQEDYQKAIEDFNQAIALDSSSYTAFYNRGNAYQELGQYQQALDDYTAAIRKQPNIKDIYINRGVVYYTLNNYEQALKDFNFALRLEEDPRARLNRAKTYIARHIWSEALNDLNKLIQQQPDHAEAYYLAGLAYQRTDQAEEACRALERASGLGNEDAETALAEYCQS